MLTIVTDIHDDHPLQWMLSKDACLLCCVSVIEGRRGWPTLTVHRRFAISSIIGRLDTASARRQLATLLANDRHVCSQLSASFLGMSALFFFPVAILLAYYLYVSGALD